MFVWLRRWLRLAALWCLLFSFPKYDLCEGVGEGSWASACGSPLCSSGRAQSPINLAVYGMKSTPSAPLSFVYEDTLGELQNRGAFFQVNVPPSATVTDEITGGANPTKLPYRLKQLSFKAPSEHRLSGVMYPMEIQLYHQNIQASYSAFAFFVVHGPRSAFLDDIINGMWAVPGQGNVSDTLVRPSLLISELGRRRSYYSYNGSLTVPPCTEGVTWFVFEQPITASPDQIDAIGARWSRRLLKPLNGRGVAYFSNDIPLPGRNGSAPQNNGGSFAVPEHAIARETAWTILVIVLAMVGVCCVGVVYAWMKTDPNKPSALAGPDSKLVSPDVAAGVAAVDSEPRV